MHPEILRIGALHLRFYGLALTLSFLVGTHLAVKRARKSQVPEDLIVWLALVVLLLAVVGSRTLYVATHWAEFRGGLGSVFMLWEGGLTMYGGTVAAIVGGIAFIKSRGYPVWRVADIVAPSLALGEAITRVGCFMNGCCFGVPTEAPWGVVFPEHSFSWAVFGATAIHPSQLYSAGLALLVFFALLWLDRRTKFDGQLFWSYILASAVARFLVDFTRYYGDGDELGGLGGLSFNNNQLIAVALVLTSLLVMHALRRRVK
ncbi:MAG: prolipoprotein diacylglyceryl transferase [Candidatus Eiseniibacteriota bacterium]|nr:MAG: prolipoprotein diacylglyceryl transferase [Candidatus Eisenbacteria bacterium]